MQYGNWLIEEELIRMRREEISAELAHERFLAMHGLDLWSVIRRALRRQPRPLRVANAADPVRSVHRPLASRSHLVKAQPAGAGGDEGNAAA